MRFYCDPEYPYIEGIKFGARVKIPTDNWLSGYFVCEILLRPRIPRIKETQNAQDNLMEDAKSFMTTTEPAIAGLFRLLNTYEHHKMRAFIDIVNSKTLGESSKHQKNYTSVDIAREVISGSIIQIAYIATKLYAKLNEKPHCAIRFEAEINRLIKENKSTKAKPISFPEKFCVGREIGGLPIGLIIFAARNQYNHIDADRLKGVNEVVFNHMHCLWPNPPNGMSFDLCDNNFYYSYSVLAALGWTDDHNTSGQDKYRADLTDIVGVEL